MSRTTTSATRAAIFAQETADEFVVLLTIDHDTLTQPIRVNSSGATITSRTDEFIALPFTLSLPDDTPDRPPRAKITIDNIDRTIVQSLRSITSRLSVLMEIVRATAPDTVEASYVDFKLTNATYDSLTIEGDLTVEEYMDEPYPKDLFSPSSFPGLF